MKQISLQLHNQTATYFGCQNVHSCHVHRKKSYVYNNYSTFTASNEIITNK